MKARLHLSMAAIAHADKVHQIATWTGIADSVVFVSVALPAALSQPRLPCGDARRDAINDGLLVLTL